ncbi:MAG: ParB N-terminal domain-containing protein [Selenomonadaceae bacterium]|nr:ParB N-terminal domain-containing protein [Selenomonadaceae bacterium]
MEVKEFALSELIPYEKNPRKNDNAVDAVANSIKTFGFKVPLVIDADKIIVCGHTRYKAAQKLGLESVPCVIADDLSPELIRAFRLADNKTAELAGWNFELLDMELADISFDMNEFGFADSPYIDFNNIEDLTEESYTEPKQKKLSCPKCGYTAQSSFFNKNKS